MVNIAWAATSTASGRFDALDTRSDIADLNDRFEELRARGEGYLELRRTEDFPVLTVGFRGPVAVLQVLLSPEAVSLLKGDGSVENDQVEVPFMDETAEFSGESGVGVDRAWGLALSFLRGRDLSELGEWVEL